MQSGPLVSIVITCYNYGRYLGQAIASALAQTYQPVEVIVVDDGSTDETVAVAGRYPVTLIRQPNQGPSAAANTGIRAARGELFTLLNADDVLHPLFLERTVPLLIEHPELAFVYTHGRSFGADRALALAQGSTIDALRWGNTLLVTSLMRKQAFEAVGGFDSELRFGEDWELYLRLVEQGHRGALVPEALVFIRAHGASLRHRTRSGDAWRDMRRIWERHPQIFTPAFRLRWRLRRALHESLHRLALFSRAASPGLYEQLRGYLRFLRPRAPDLERARADERPDLAPPIPPGIPGPWEEVA